MDSLVRDRLNAVSRRTARLAHPVAIAAASLLLVIGLGGFGTGAQAEKSYH